MKVLFLSLALTYAAASHAAAPEPAVPPVLGSFPNLEGLPQAPYDDAPNTESEVHNAPGADEPGCKSVDPALRAMVFRHYENLQQMQNTQGHFFPGNASAKAAHLLGMVPKESSGDPTNATDMNGKEFATYKAISTLARWKSLFDQKIVYNKQTNYGLAQMSMDRMLAGNTVTTDLDDFLGAVAHPTAGLDVRRILTVYQELAQGRLTQEDIPISQKALQDPRATSELKAQAQEGISAALWHCGTRFLFKEGYTGAEGQKALEAAMASIAYCDFGKDRPDPNSRSQAQCFGHWVTLCPALNLDLAMLTPDSYFATHRAAPLCQATFQRLTKKRPSK
jgi:hypothetical protein